MATTIEELAGRYKTGDRCWPEGKPHRVVRVIRETYWDSDRIDDEDEFGRPEGWYTEAEVEADQLTLEESARIETDRAEKAGRRAKAQAEATEYREKLAALRARHAELTAGLERAADVNMSVFHGLSWEKIGAACEPGKGCSGVTELAIGRDESGAAKAVSFGCPYDFGPSYWAAPELLAAGRDRSRVWQWWNPDTYGADTYPGPGVPIEELTAEERAEVDHREAARLADLRAREVRSCEITARQTLIKLGLIEPADRSEKPYTPVPVRPFRALSYSVEFGAEFEEFLRAYAAQHRSRRGDRPSVRLRLRVALPAAAFDRPSPRSRKPPAVESLPRETRGHNFLTFDLAYERGQ